MKCQRGLYGTVLLVAAIIPLTNCAMYHWAHSKMAHAAMQHRKLKDGSQVIIGANMAPSKQWHCQRVARNYQIDREDLERWSVFSIGGEEKLLADKAVEYANKHHIKSNYINLHTASHKVASERASHQQAKHHDKPIQPHAVFYRCDKINPQQHLGVSRRQDKQFHGNDAST